MKVIVVDDERLALDYMVELLKRMYKDIQVEGFIKPRQAFSYLSDHEVDVALLDIEMGSMNGLTLAQKCKELQPHINIIFITGYDQYTLEALRLHASGYLLKPVREQELQIELDNLRHPLPTVSACQVYFQTFGNFEVFVDGKPLHFPMAKCKEALAYLVDRKGACVTAAELAAVLWEDQPHGKILQNNTHRVISDLMKTIRQAGVSEILIKTRKEIAIDKNNVDCDYYRFLEGNVPAINTFCGEYMTNYSWAEFTLAGLTRIEKKQ